MYSCKFAMCAESIIIDRATNQLSVINLIEDMQAHGFPLVIPKLATVFYLSREDGDNPNPNVSLRLNATEEATDEFPVNVPFGEKLKNRLVTTIKGVIMPGPGTLRVSLMVDENEIGHWKFEVILKGEPPQIDVQQE